MKHTFFRLSLLTVFSLGACSLNTYNYLPAEKQREIDQKAQEVENKAIAIAAKERCPKMIFGKLPREVSPPTKELSKVQPGDDAAIQALLLRYIDQLKNENRHLRKVIADDRSHYLDKCLDYATERVRNPD